MLESVREICLESVREMLESVREICLESVREMLESVRERDVRTCERKRDV